MSQANMELHRRLVAAFNHARDVEAFIACLDPSVEYHSVMTVPGGAVYHGHDGVRKYFGDFKDAWGDEFRVEPEAFFDLGEQTLLFYVLHGRGRQSGAPITGGLGPATGAVFELRGGQILRVVQFVSYEESLEAVGLSE